MVQKVTQTIQVYGASFKVESDEPLVEEQKKVIVDAFEKYPENIVNTLSKGRSGEPPLKLVVAAVDNWVFFSTDLVGYLSVKIAPSRLSGAYNPVHNTMFLQKRYLVEKLVDHELAHAVDDFARTRFLNGGNTEVGAASDLLIDDHFFDDHPHLMNRLSLLYYGGTPLNSWPHWKPEVFACTLTAEFDYIESLPGGEKLVSKIKSFLKNYPHISDVDPREQFQTNDLPSELLESSEKDWKR